MHIHQVTKLRAPGYFPTKISETRDHLLAVVPTPESDGEGGKTQASADALIFDHAEKVTIVNDVH